MEWLLEGMDVQGIEGFWNFGRLQGTARLAKPAIHRSEDMTLYLHIHRGPAHFSALSNVG